MGIPMHKCSFTGTQQDQLSTRAASREIILGDIGGWNGFVSSVYLAGPGPFLYHLYDDRGLDVLGGSQKLLLPLYHQFHDWILEYDLEKIDQMFAPAKE